MYKIIHTGTVIIRIGAPDTGLPYNLPFNVFLYRQSIYIYRDGEVHGAGGVKG